MPPSTHSDIDLIEALPSAAQLAALLQKAGLSSLRSVGWIRVTDEDRVRWLNGMVTNSVQDLPPGRGCYNFLLSVQGRIQGDAYIFAEPEALLLETASEQVPTLMALLDHFIIMDDVELADWSAARSGISISGPKAAALLQRAGIDVSSREELTMQTTSWNSGEVTLIHTYSPLVPRFELWAEHKIAEDLSRVLVEAGAVVCGPQSQDWLRLLEGTPRYGTDIRDRELPQETGQTRALHFAKGCYLGQEIVERIRSRGNVHRGLTAFRLEGPLPAAGTGLEADGKQVGELTSTAAIPLPAGPESPEQPDLQLGLGYIRREALERNLPVQYPGGEAVAISLPFTTIEALRPQLASESSERV